MANSKIKPGMVFAADFRIVRALARGGMGQVFVAEQISTGRQRALKVMVEDLDAKPEARRRFVQEAKVGATIESEHVVQVVAAGDDASTGALWLAMELLEGEDLRTRLERVGALAPEEVVRILEQVAHAIDAAHARGVVHRDLKPENVFLWRTKRSATDEIVKVLDFGIAKLVDETRTSHTGAIGTPLWMSPEQSQPGGAITSAADIWALGLIAFRALTGAPFWLSASGPNMSAMALLREILIDPIPPPSVRASELGVPAPPARFDAWFAQCSARDPRARFRTASAAVNALRAAIAGPGTAVATVRSAPVEAPATHPPSDPRAFADTALPTGYGAPMGATATRVPSGDPTAVDARPRAKTRPLWPFILGAISVLSAIVVVVVATSSSSTSTSGTAKSQASQRKVAPSASAPASPSARIPSAAPATPSTAPTSNTAPTSAACAECPGAPQGQPSQALQSMMKGAGTSVITCYTDALLRGEKGAGLFLVNVVVGPTGEACDVVVQRDDVGMPAVSTCIVNRLRARKWPAPTSGCVNFALPLDLKER